MSSSVTALRCPVLSFMRQPESLHSQEDVNYLPDALIILDQGKILDFGPAHRLQTKIPEDTDIKYTDECRIIRSVCK